MYFSDERHRFSLFFCTIQLQQKLMDSQQVVQLFREEVWTKKLNKQLIIPSLTFILETKDIQYLIDDETNPNIQYFTLNKQIQKGIKQLNGAVFMKCAGRSPKDIVSFDRKMKSVKDVVMAIKVSEYLTQGLSEQFQGCQLILRQYCQQLNDSLNQFRAYVMDGRLVGICQKNPSFIAEEPTINQIKRIQQISIMISQQFSVCTKHQQKQQNKEFVFDIYCQQNGKRALLIAIEPFHIHALCLFNDQQLRNHSKSGNNKPLIKTVRNQNQLKEINLSQYRAGNQLKNYQNMKEWIDFMQKQQ